MVCARPRFTGQPMQNEFTTIISVPGVYAVPAYHLLDLAVSSECAHGERSSGPCCRSEGVLKATFHHFTHLFFFFFFSISRCATTTNNNNRATVLLLLHVSCPSACAVPGPTFLFCHDLLGSSWDSEILKLLLLVVVAHREMEKK